MLKRLTVENYALIEKLEVSWEKGLTIITGETGAGKSILLGALSLILGQRADSQVLYDKSRKCYVEGEFDISFYDLQAFFSQHDLDYEPNLLLRREINPQGKSRAFINDTPVVLNVLKELAVRLIDIHSQHQSLDLYHPAFQTHVIDSFGGQQDVFQHYTQEFAALKEVRQHLKKLQDDEVQQKKDQDYYRFLFDELEKANLRDDEMQGLEAEMARLTHAENILESLAKASGLLSGGDENILLQLNQAHQALAQAARFDTTLEEPAGRLHSLIIEAKELAYDLEQKAGTVVIDPGRASELAARLDLLYRLMQKHQVQTTAELLQLKETFDQKLLGISSLETSIEKALQEIDVRTQQLEKTAALLREGRKKCIPSAEKKLLAYLKKLGMPDARIRIACEPLEDFSVTGKDVIRFLFNANKGGELQETAHVASGGEISRLMLAVKSLISQANLLPTIIFDEIDTGVSGEVAALVGEILLALSERMQVITITHLPQIAACGQHHLLVYKQSDREKTRTHIRQLPYEERIIEIAQMIGGLDPGDNARETAVELMAKRGQHLTN